MTAWNDNLGAGLAHGLGRRRCLDGLGMWQRLDGREEAGGDTWMAERRWDEAPSPAWWQGGAGRGGGSMGKASTSAGTGRDRRGEG